jgi:hypothetical protein
VATRSGFSTVDGVLAIVLLSLAALGAGGAMARSARALGQANREVAAARTTEQVIERLRGTLSAAGDRCGGIGSGSIVAGPTGVSWSPTPVTAGIDLRVITTYPGFQRPRSDTLRAFLPCH